MFQTKSPAFPWMLLFIIYMVSNFFVQGMTHVAFPYTMVYSLAFLLIAISLSKDGKTGDLFGFMMFAVALLTQITSAAYIFPPTAMVISIIFTALALLDELGIVKLTKTTKESKLFLMGAFAGILFFALMWVLSWLPINQQWWVWPASYAPWYVYLNHIGFALLAGIDMVILLDFGTWEKWAKWRLLFFALTVIGALVMLATNWGLQIL